MALSRQLSAAGRHEDASWLYAALGDTLATMESFRKLWDRGVWPSRAYHIYHRAPWGILLRDYPAFRELTRVRD